MTRSRILLFVVLPVLALGVVVTFSATLQGYLQGPFQSLKAPRGEVALPSTIPPRTAEDDKRRADEAAQQERALREVQAAAADAKQRADAEARRAQDALQEQAEKKQQTEERPARRGAASGSRSVTPEPGSQAEAELPSFPWPPPAPSSRDEIDRRLVAAAGSEPSLRAVADKLEAALKRTHYEYSFYSVPGGGFALAARLERITDDGTAMGGDTRFLPPDAKARFDLSGYLKALFFAPPGYYRMIALVVTDQPFGRNEKALDQATAEKLPVAGATMLPQEFSTRPFGPNFRVWALVYEFNKVDAANVQPVVPGRLPALTHMTRSGLASAFEPGR